MSEPTVSIKWKTGDVINDRHIGRYRRCLYELISELRNSKSVDNILDKYTAILLEDYKVGLEFPSDFDQSVLPEELR